MATKHGGLNATHFEVLAWVRVKKPPKTQLSLLTGNKLSVSSEIIMSCMLGTTKPTYDDWSPVNNLLAS